MRAEFPGQANHLGQFVAEIEPQIERDLVVARSRGMELAPRRPDPLGQAALDREMDILVGQREAEAAGIDLALDRVQAGDDFGGLGAAQQAGSRQHPRMRDRPADVMPIEAPVERKRSGEGFHLRQAWARKAAANQAAGSVGARARRFGGGAGGKLFSGDMAWASRFFHFSFQRGELKGFSQATRSCRKGRTCTSGRAVSAGRRYGRNIRALRNSSRRWDA